VEVLGAIAGLAAMAGIMAVGSVVERRAGARAIRRVLGSRGWTDIEVRYRPTFWGMHIARFHLSARLPDGTPRDGFAYVGSWPFGPPINTTIRLWERGARPVEALDLEGER
jgi:hypothetical protein